SGVVRVTPSSALTPLDDRASYFESLPSAGSALDTFYRTRDDFLEPYYDARGVERKFDFSAANIYRKYGSNWKDDYTDHVKLRFRKWGINTISAGSDVDMVNRLQLPYCERL